MSWILFAWQYKNIQSQKTVFLNHNQNQTNIKQSCGIQMKRIYLQKSPAPKGQGTLKPRG